MNKICLLHPFTSKAAGALEKSAPTYHSQPHLKAFEILTKETGYDCCMEYFTQKRRTYTKMVGSINYTFFPVTFKWNGDHKKWKKQSSKSCMNAYEKDIPDVTIINMSGHSSPFSYELSKLIIQKDKKYIAMLGGQHYSNNDRNIDYYKNADHILVHTHMQKKEMETMELFKNKDIRVFPLGVDCEVFKPLEEKEIVNPKLLYVGRIVEWKRVHLAIQAVKMLVDNGFKEAVLNIIGPVSSEDYFLKLKKMIVDLSLEKNVNFLGHKEHADLPSYFQDADLFVLPSDKETFGMVMIEAMACGTPVAGIDCPGGPADVITHLENGLLSSPEDYSKTILEFFINNQGVQEISKNARIKAVNEYSIETTYKVLHSSVLEALEIN
jgi:glycosyltransferase involved in cell wall biosynthesis